jgi:hypothetical protein
VAFSPQANYTDWATATGRRILVPTFVDRGLSRGQRGVVTTAVNLSFLDRSRYFSFKVAPQLSWRGWVDPVSDALLLRKSGSAENRTRDLCYYSQKLWLPDHRGGLQYSYRKILCKWLLENQRSIHGCAYGLCSVKASGSLIESNPAETKLIQRQMPNWLDWSSVTVMWRILFNRNRSTFVTS